MFYQAKKLSLILILFLFTGCSIEMGNRIDSSNFIHPNSNVTPLGQTNSEVSKIGIIIPSSVSRQEYRELFNKALNKYQDADAIINMGIDVKYTNYLNLIHTTELTLTGTAVNVEVGEQDLSEFRENMFQNLVDQGISNAK